MKKRIFALMMAGIMTLSSSIAVFAEAEEAPAEFPTLTWAEVEPQIADNESWAGDFVTFEDIAIAMYVPDSFEPVELSDEDLEAGYVGYFTLGEEAAVGVQYVDMDGMELDEYAALLTEEYGVTDATLMLINEIGALSYTNPDDENVGVIAIATQMGYIMEFSFSPITDEGFQVISSVMIASIQNVQMGEAEE